MKLDEILKNHFEAVGQEKRAEIKTIKTSGKQIMQGMEFGIAMSQKRPNKIKVNVEVQGMSIVQAYDGTNGYMINPMTGSSEPQDFPEEQLKSFKDQADIDGKLFHYKEKGTSIELEGVEEIDGKNVYKLKLTDKAEKEGEDPGITHYFIDAESFMLKKIAKKMNANGNEMEVETIFSNYKQVDGVSMAYSIETKMNGNSFAQLTIDEIKFNEEIPDNKFERPLSEESK